MRPSTVPVTFAMPPRRRAWSAAGDGGSANAGATAVMKSARATRRLAFSRHRRRGPPRAEVLPERGPAPVGLAPPRVGLVIVEGARKEDGDHLLAAAVPQAETPRRRHARAAVGAEERRARDATDRREPRVAARVMIADAE